MITLIYQKFLFSLLLMIWNLIWRFEFIKPCSLKASIHERYAPALLCTARNELSDWKHGHVHGCKTSRHSLERGICSVAPLLAGLLLAREKGVGAENLFSNLISNAGSSDAKCKGISSTAKWRTKKCHLIFPNRNIANVSPFFFNAALIFASGAHPWTLFMPGLLKLWVVTPNGVAKLIGLTNQIWLFL